MNKTLELLKLFEKFGVKPGKIIGAGDRKVVPIKKPILSKPLNRDYILGDVEEGKIGINTVKNEIEDIAPLFFQKQLNDVEINNIVNNLNYLDKLLNPTNILDITTKAPVKGLESLKPTSIAGGLEKAGKQLEEVGKKLEETKPEINIGDLIKDFAQGQRAMQDEYKRGLTRATARSILYKDIEAGKIKGMTFEQLGSAKDPIDDFRKIYGEDALEKLDSLTDNFAQMRSAEEAANFAKTRFKFEPRTSTLPETTTIEEAKKAEQEFGINKPAKVTDFKAEATKRTSIDDLIDEYNANQDRLRLSDEEGGTAIGYDEFRKLQERNRQIADALENKGISSTPEVEDLKPEGIVIPFRKKITEPEEFADGGITRTKFAAGGKGKKVLDIIKKANKDLKGKKSMETVNPKTGEVTVPDEFVTTAEEPRTLGGLPIDERSANISDEIDKLRASGINSLENEKKLNRLSLEFVDSLDPGRRKKALDYRRKSLDTENKLIIKAEEKGLDFDTYEKLRQGLYGPRKQQTLDFIKTGKVNIEPVKPVTTFKETQNRFKTAAKAADEIFPNYDQPKTAASELAEVMAEQKYGKVFDDLSGDQQQELYEEAYNYITSVNKLPKRAPENMLTPPVAKENKPIEGGFSFNDPDIKAQMEEAMKEAKKRGDEMRAMGLDPASGRDYDKYIEIKTKSGDKDFNKYFDDLEIKTKFKGVISDDLLNQILIDDNPQRKAEVIATIEQGLTMQEKGMDPQEIINILKNTTRTKQAKGGSVGLNYLMGF
jgi:hypothetical protein